MQIIRHRRDTIHRVPIKHLFYLFVICLWVIAPAWAQTEIVCEDLAPEGAGPTYFIGQGNAFYGQGDYTRAIATYSCAIESNPEYAPAYVNRGFAYASQRDDVSAMADYNRALELDETLLSAYNNRGILYTSQGNFGLALTDFSLVISLNPEDAIAYHNRAIVHAAERDYDSAMADLQQAITLAPDYAAPHATLGAVYLAMAADSYQEYSNLAGETAPVPNGSASLMLGAVTDSVETGNFSAWLAFFTPAQ